MHLFPKILSLAYLALLLKSQCVEGEEDFVVAAYLPDYRAYINVNNTAPFLTDLILFSMELSEDGELGPCCSNPHHFEQAR